MLTEAHMSQAVKEALSMLGKESLRGQQREAVDAILCGGDVIYIFPTGTGKSLVYEVTGLVADGVSVIVSPLIGLLQEQVQRITAAGVAVIEACGQNLAFYGNEEDVQMIYTTPEQLRRTSDLVAYVEKRGTHIARLVVDEAHLVYEWDEFRCVLPYSCDGKFAGNTQQSTLQGRTPRCSGIKHGCFSRVRII